MKKIIFLLAWFLGFSMVSAQVLTPEVIGTTGTTLTAPTFSIAYTIGEPITKTLSSGSYSLTQGFHQDTILIVAVEDHLPDFGLSVYPVPVDQSLTVTCTRDDLIQVQLYDANGKSVLTTDVFTKKLTFDVQNLSNGPYMLIVMTPNAEPIKTFSIVKTSTH